MKKTVSALFLFCVLVDVVTLPLAAKDTSRHVTISVLYRFPVSTSENPNGQGGGGVLTALDNRYGRFFMLDVSVSDDPGKVYLISCLEYRVWNNCGLTAADSYEAEIKGDTMRIITKGKDKKGKEWTSRVNYHIGAITNSPEERR